MKPFTFFRRPSAAAAVAPLPIETPFEQQLKPLLHDLLLSDPSSSSSFPCSNSIWFVQALQASTKTQSIALNSINSISFQESDRPIVENYLEDNNVKVLDACNLLSEKMEIVQDYVKSLRVVSHLVIQGNFEPNLQRALDLLDSSVETLERRLKETLLLENKKKKVINYSSSEYSEILNGSMGFALMVCGMLGNALSLSKSKRRRLHKFQLPTTFDQFKDCRKAGSSSMVLFELQQTLKVARDLQLNLRLRNRSDQIAEELKSKCDELEGKIMALDSGVRDLYKHLISVRMALLGTLSVA
ncbi:hypothetical protein CCACVL1_07391 [Corchorus capsularis]|uniref:Protein BYPASS-related protein n=1 Tax=Corchorus capsularis TaxID=210143 RepID=A0A1R3J665_COCAP|nr:hypothetical protein CCACVL1_07391 [Corchorus capsularis]